MMLVDSGGALHQWLLHCLISCFVLHVLKSPNFPACGFAMPWFCQVRVAAMLLWFVVRVACAGSWFAACCC